MTSRLRLRKVATPPAARSGQETVFVDRDDDHLKSIDSAGSVTDLESGGGGPWVDIGSDSYQLGGNDEGHIVVDPRHIWMYDYNGDLRLEIDPTDHLTIWDGGQFQLFKIDIVSKVLYFSPGGTNAFAVYDDGSVHIKTGTTIVADL